MTESPNRVESSGHVTPLDKTLFQSSVAVAGIVLAICLSVMQSGLIHQDSKRPHGQAGATVVGVSDAVVPPAGILLDLNAVDANELALVPGIGPVLAARIINDRRTNGDFEDLESLTRVRGIGPKILKEVRGICFVDQPLPDSSVSTGIGPSDSGDNGQATRIANSRR